MWGHPGSRQDPEGVERNSSGGEGTPVTGESGVRHRRRREGCRRRPPLFKEGGVSFSTDEGLVKGREEGFL